MLKRLAVIGAAVAGVVFLRKKAKQQATETVDPSTASGPDQA